MGLSSEMKNLSEEILDSFKQRIKENEELVSDVQKTLDGFRKDHQEMAAIINSNATDLRVKLNLDEKNRLKEADILMKEIVKEHKEMAETLRSGLDLDEKNRMEDFDNLMKNINEDIKSINEEVLAIFKDTNEMLEEFNKEHLEMSNELRTDLSKNLAERVEYTRTLLNGFQKKLSEISKENQKMAQKLRKDLDNGEVVRLSDYNGIMNGIHTAIKGIQKEVKGIQKTTSGMMSEYAKDRKGASTAWDNMQNAIAKLRNSGNVTSTEAIKKVEKKEIKVEIPVEIVKEAPIEANPVFTTLKEEPKTLEQKVLEFINNHPKGVKISEMEIPLNETRMKLGYTTKVLLDLGEIQKIDNVYFIRK
jgi:hypothetical protein